LDEYDLRGDAARAARRAGRYFVVVVVTFLIPNLPYLIASPSAWAQGVFVPFVKSMVPSGQGLISLTLFVHLGGGSLAAYTIVFALMAALVLVVFVGTYPLLRPATFMLASIAYFFAARSQTNYLIPFIPVALVAAVTASPAVPRRSLARGRAALGQGVAAGREAAANVYGGAQRLANGAGRPIARVMRSRPWAWATAGVAALAALAIIYTLTSTPPLQITVVGKQTTGYLGGINALDIRVHNRTDRTVTPHYTVQTTHGDTTFWYVSSGPAAIPPEHTVRLTLAVANYQGEPGLSDDFSVLAFTTKPATVSVSDQFAINLWRTATLPEAFDKPVPVGGRGVLLRVQVIDHLNSAVQIAGIPVYLSQSRYTPLGVRRAYAKINGHKPGQSNVIARTNRQGVAVFHIVGTRAGPVPTTIAAHLRDKHGGGVYGSSGQMLISFYRAIQ
jgi:heme/copper-type cytochrome/quinol oxidase subunit 4